MLVAAVDGCNMLKTSEEEDWQVKLHVNKAQFKICFYGFIKAL